MSQLPSESDNPTYDETKYSDDYVKFMLPGVREALPDGDPVIINKIGLAYGFTTDTAVVLDRKTGRWFAITGTMYTNENGILNDNVYEYETVAFPFWRALGRELSRRLLAP